MSLAFVKATKLESGSGTSWGGSVSVTAGSLLVSGGVTGYSTIGTGINTTDNNGSNTWARDANGTHTYTNTPSKNAFSESSCPNAAGGTYTVTFTPQGGSGASGGTGSVFEFSGADTTSPNDATSPALNTADPSASVASNSLTNTTANAVFVGMFGDNQSSGTATVTGTSSGWTFPANGVETNATSFYVFGMGYKIVSSIAGETATWTVTSQGWGALIAVYKEAAGSAFTWQQLTSYPDVVAERGFNAVSYRQEFPLSRKARRRRKLFSFPKLPAIPVLRPAFCAA